MSFSTALASLVVDRVFDGIVVLVLLAIGVAVAHFPTNTTIRGYSLTHAAGFVVGGALALLVAFYILVFFPKTLIRAIRARRAARVPDHRAARRRDAWRVSPKD